MPMSILYMLGTMMRAGQTPAPGLFVSTLPKMTVMGFLMVHLVYGLVVAALYHVWT